MRFASSGGGRDMRIYIGCDDSGFAMKQVIMDLLDNKKIPFIDCGSGPEPSRYPYYAAKVAAAVPEGEASTGILICGSGIGMSIAANKYPGVRAAAVSDSYTAYLTRRHNDANVLCLGGRMLGKWAVMEIVETWLNTAYGGGHHQGSLDLIKELETFNMSGSGWCPEEIPYLPFQWDPMMKL